MADRAARKSYAEKRDFGRTPEPSGDASRAAGRKASVGKAGGRAAASFVVQKHHARRLHWDFRLEHEGVLWSWAVPKGPSLDPADKRLAVHVEDHPLDYRDFSGTIPEGNYGAGTVAIWDRGTWAPLGDAAADLARGELKFRLDGERLRGGFVLVRLKPRGGEHAENWLLIKEKDDAVRPGGDAAALEGDVAGAATPAGDTAETPVPAGDAADTAPAAPRGRRRRAAPVAAAADEPASAPKRRRRAAAGSNAAPLPDRVPPELATAVEQAPSGAGWVSEIKFDGYRMLARKDGRDVRLITRNGLDWTHRLPTIARAVGRLGATRLLVDGELVALGRDGVTSFAALQDALSHGDDRKLVLYAFDLLAEDDADLRERPLLDRKARLAPLCSADGTIRYSEHLTEDAARIRERACKLGLEGLVCKRADSPYRPGRGTDWVKVKCEHREEMIILGATRPRGAREGLGAIHLGYRDGSGRLWYAGGCGTGFSDAVLRDLAARLAAAGATRPTGLVTPEKPPAGLAWCTPSLVCEIRHAGFTGGGLLRHARFLGLREDKDADEVVRDPPVDAAPPRRVRAALPAPVSAKEPAKKHAARAGAPAAVAVDAGPQRTSQRTPQRRPRERPRARPAKRPRAHPRACPRARRRGGSAAAAEAATRPRSPASACRTRIANSGRGSPSARSRHTGRRSPMRRSAASRTGRWRCCAARTGSTAKASSRNTRHPASRTRSTRAPATARRISRSTTRAAWCRSRRCRRSSCTAGARR